MEQINNITEEINNNVNVIDKPKKEYKFILYIIVK